MTRAAPPSTSAMARLASPKTLFRSADPPCRVRSTATIQEVAARCHRLAEVLQSVHWSTRKTIRGGVSCVFSSAGPRRHCREIPRYRWVNSPVTFESAGPTPGALARDGWRCALGRQKGRPRASPIALAVPAPGPAASSSVTEGEMDDAMRRRERREWPRIASPPARRPAQADAAGEMRRQRSMLALTPGTSISHALLPPISAPPRCEHGATAGKANALFLSRWLTPPSCPRRS